jgi:predicted nucleic acid-binding protein
MILTIDTNILLAGLIKDSTVRKIIVESGWGFYYPEMSFHEVRKYKDLVLETLGNSVCAISSLQCESKQLNFRRAQEHAPGFSPAVLDKSGMSEEEYTELLNHLLKHITLVTEEQINPKIDEADKLLGNVDPDDVVFLATAFSIENSKIWSDDLHLEKQNKIRVFKTKHIVKLFFS